MKSDFNSINALLSVLPTKVVPVSGQALTIPAGAAGTIVEFQIQAWPILSSDGGLAGGKGDTSLSFGTGTCFTTEVAPNTADSALTNGQYYINYATGRGRGKKATTATSDTVSYKMLGLSVVENYAPDAENNDKDVINVETHGSGSSITADTLLKTGAGKLYALTFSCTDATPTAGSIDVYDNISAAGTKLFTWAIPAAYFAPFTLAIDVLFTNGCYVDFTTTADVAVTPSIR